MIKEKVKKDERKGMKSKKKDEWKSEKKSCKIRNLKI